QQPEEIQQKVGHIKPWLLYRTLKTGIPMACYAFAVNKNDGSITLLVVCPGPYGAASHEEQASIDEIEEIGMPPTIGEEGVWKLEATDQGTGVVEYKIISL